MADLVLSFALLAFGAAGEPPLAEAEMGARFCPRLSGVFPGRSMRRSMWRTAARNVTRVRNGGPLDPRPSPLVCHPLAFDILLASPRPSEPLTDRGFASLSCPRYSFRLFG